MALESVIPYLRNRLLSTILGTSIGFAAADALKAPLRDFTFQLNQTFSNVPLDPADAALAVVRGVMDYTAAVDEAGLMGLNRERLDWLINTAGRPPDLSDLLTLLRRGRLTPAQAREALAFSDTKDQYHGDLLALARQLLSADEWAQMRVQGIASQAEAVAGAAATGYDAADAERLYRLHGDPPAPQQALELWNRGVIDEPTFERAYRQSRLKPEWIEQFKALRFHLESPAELILFLVREVFTPEIRRRFGQDDDYPEAATAEGHKLGISEELMRDYWAAHWELPSVEQGFDMFHRGELDDADLATLLRAKDIMPFWRARLTSIAYRLPGRIDLRRMFRHGVIDRDRVHRGYRQLGYTDEVAALLTQFAVAEKQAPEKDLSKAEIVAEYEARMIGRASAMARVQGLGYSEQEAGAIIDLAEYRARKTFRTATVSVVRSRYVAREIDRAVATERLDRIGVPSEGRDELLELWTFEQAESPTRLTEAQSRAALKAKVIEEPEYRANLAQLGYEAHSIDVLTQLATR